MMNPFAAINPYLQATLEGDQGNPMQSVMPALPAVPQTPVTDFSDFARPNLQTPPPVNGGDTDWAKLLFGGKGADGSQSMGALLPGIQAAGGLAQSWLGFQQLGLMKDSLAFQKKAYADNMANQTKLVNSQLEDRQNARQVQTNGSMMDTTEYMNKYGL